MVKHKCALHGGTGRSCQLGKPDTPRQHPELLPNPHGGFGSLPGFVPENKLFKMGNSEDCIDQ